MKSFWIIIFLASVTNVAMANESVEFADVKLKEAIEKKLGITDLTQEEMLNLSELETTSIIDLSGLEYAKKLIRLRINNTFFLRRPYTDKRIENISSLSSLNSLISLELRRNHIADLTPLKSLSNLTELNLMENRIEDISVLSSLTNLETLNLARNSLSDISALHLLPNLRYLELQWTEIQDINALSSLTNLELLNLQGNNISDISALSDLTKLQYLDLSENQISDITPLSSLKNLSRLSLKFNKVNDVSALSSLPNLQNVDITNNPYYLKRFILVTGSIIGTIFIIGVLRWLFLHRYKTNKKRFCLRTKLSIICCILVPFLWWFLYEHLQKLLSYETIYNRYGMITRNNLFLISPITIVLIVGFISAISILTKSKSNQNYVHCRSATIVVLYLLVIESIISCLVAFFYLVLKNA